MLRLNALLDLLGYSKSRYFRTSEADFEPESAHYFRSAKETGGEHFSVKGFYVFRTASPGTVPLPPRPAVCVGEALTSDAARKLHRRVWNVGNVPFLIVLLPGEVRIYSGFQYEHGGDAGLVLQIASAGEPNLRACLHDFTASSIDSAEIWLAQKRNLDTRFRVDATLLQNLGQLAQALHRHCVPKLDLPLAHALIGKFVFLRYLRDRGILDDSWLRERKVDINRIFGPGATLAELSKLDAALESRFNGDVFHIEFDRQNEINDTHVGLVASVLAGDEISTGETGFARQLHLEFKAYDFRHIPVETLSSIYEQFLHAQNKGRSEGAFYTPEVLADYLLAEVDSIRRISAGTKILDPSCGSGVFLVLAYRRLIELELAEARKKGKELDPMRLREILLESIYGVERQLDACNVTVFSLILTLLHYIDPPTLHANGAFKFPALLNKRIFCEDFFDPKAFLTRPKGGFDVIIGNPPWIELKPGTGEGHAEKWILEEGSVSGRRVADAFALKAGRLLTKDGVAGLLLPATTLFTLEGKRFREKFFCEFTVRRVTNLANLRSNLFGGRATQPTMTVVFQKPSPSRLGVPIIHYGPFAANQFAGDAGQLWALTVHGSEIQPVEQVDAATGETSVWKLALWGTPRDARALAEIRKLFPMTLAEFCASKGWGDNMPRQGAELRMRGCGEELVYCGELQGKKRFDTAAFNRLVQGGMHFSLPAGVLRNIPDEMCYVRKRGGTAGVAVNRPAHLLISATWKNLLLYSEKYFAIPPRQMGISANGGKSDDLRALAVYLGSSLVDYFIFFHVPEWGVYSTFPHVVLRAVRGIPTPDFTPAQVEKLAETHRQIVAEETEPALLSNESRGSSEKQRLIDQRVFAALGTPEYLKLLVEDFRDMRLPLDLGAGALKKIGEPVKTSELVAYGEALRNELNRFLMGEAGASVSIIASRELIACEVRLGRCLDDKPIAVAVRNVESERDGYFSSLRRMLTQKFSQWVYLERSLFVHTRTSAQIFRSPRRMDWSRTQALNDADALIAEALVNWDGEQ